MMPPLRAISLNLGSVSSTNSSVSTLERSMIFLLLENTRAENIRFPCLLVPSGNGPWGAIQYSPEKCPENCPQKCPELSNCINSYFWDFLAVLFEGFFWTFLGTIFGTVLNCTPGELHRDAATFSGVGTTTAWAEDTSPIDKAAIRKNIDCTLYNWGSWSKLQKVNKRRMWKWWIRWSTQLIADKGEYLVDNWRFITVRA